MAEFLYLGELTQKLKMIKTLSLVCETFGKSNMFVHFIF